MIREKVNIVTGYVWGNSRVLSVSEYPLNWMIFPIRSLAITALCAASAAAASNPVLEKACLPDSARVVDAAIRLLKKPAHERR